MNFVVSKLNRDFTLHLVACDENEQKFLESHIGEIVELSSRPTPRTPDAGDSAAFLDLFYPIFNLLNKVRRDPPQRR